MGVARFTPLWQQSLQLPLSISLDSMHPLSSKQHSCSPSPLAFSMSSSVALASSFPSLQTPMLFSKHAHHPSLTHARTISLNLLLPSEPLFPSIPTSPQVLCPLFLHQFCTTHCSYHGSLSPSQNFQNFKIFSC